MVYDEHALARASSMPRRRESAAAQARFAQGAGPGLSAVVRTGTSVAGTRSRQAPRPVRPHAIHPAKEPIMLSRLMPRCGGPSLLGLCDIRAPGVARSPFL